MRHLTIASLGLLLLVLSGSALQAQAPCASCEAVTPLVNEQSRNVAPDWSQGTIRECRLINSAGQWNNYCRKNELTSCPPLNSSFFRDHTVVAVSFDGTSPVFCDQVGPDPGYELTCVAADDWEVRPRITETTSFGCSCTRNPQLLVTVFVADAITKTGADRCTPCIESRSEGCLNPF